MSKIVTSMSQFKKILQGRIELATKFTQNDIYKVIQEKIKDYYEEPVFYGRAIPTEYERTYSFLNSLLKTEIVISNNTLSCEVRIDMDSLDYIQPAEIVINMINAGYHADPSLNDRNYQTPKVFYSGSSFWDDAIAELGGENGIMNLYKNNLKKCGVPVH